MDDSQNQDDTPHPLKNAELIDTIEGYVFPIITPFGKVLSLCADLYSVGRSLRLIENHISRFVRPYASYQTRSTAFSEKVRQKAKKSIFEQLRCSPELNECLMIPPGSEIEAYTKIQSLFLEQVSKEKPGVKVNVYLYNGSSYAGAIPWLTQPDRNRIITLDQDKTYGGIISIVQKNAKTAKYHVIQFQITKEKIDVASLATQMQALQQEYPSHSFTCVIDVTNFILSGRPQKELDDIFTFFDFIIVQTNKMLGGQLASNFVLAKKSKLAKLSSKIDFSSIQDEEPSAMFRTAQVIEFHKINNISYRTTHQGEFDLSADNNLQKFYKQQPIEKIFYFIYINQ